MRRNTAQKLILEDQPDHEPLMEQRLARIESDIVIIRQETHEFRTLMQTTTQAANEAITWLKVAVATLDGKLNTLAEKVNTKADAVQVSAIDQRLDRLESKVDHLDARIDKLDARIDKLDARVDKLDTKIDVLSEKVGKQGEAIGDLKVTMKVIVWLFGVLVALGLLQSGFAFAQHFNWFEEGRSPVGAMRR